jgi:tetratricopeptide (TPR) repeat protein
MPAKATAKRRRSARQEQRDLDVQIGFIEGLLRRDPGYVDALQLLGDNYTRRGRYADGLQVDERLARLEPRNPLVLYNLACSYALTGQFERGLKTLARALRYGYRDFNWLRRDPDLRKLRRHPGFAKIQLTIRQLEAGLTE